HSAMDDVGRKPEAAVADSVHAAALRHHPRPGKCTNLTNPATVLGTGPDDLEIERSLPHGHVAAVLGTIRKIALDRLILSTAKDAASRRHCDLVIAMLVDRLIAPRSKLGFVRAVDEETAASGLGAVLRLGEVKG